MVRIEAGVVSTEADEAEDKGNTETEHLSERYNR